MRLSQGSLRLVPPHIERPTYDRGAVRTGVVHFGPGAFHRAHQAFYFDRMLHLRPDFGVCTVSLRSPSLAHQLAPQYGLYTLVEQAAEPRLRIIGAHTFFFQPLRGAFSLLKTLANPETRIVTATVTEKGYCLTPAGDLDIEHQEIQHDLARPEYRRTLVGWLVAGLARRRAEGAGGLVAMSCDNLTDNSARLRQATVQFADSLGDHDLARWIEDEVRFPATMVDSITPAADDALRALVAARLGLEDAAPVQREPFAQWVIEDQLGADAAAFAEAGVTITHDVAGFERAKLRLLNGAHSTLAYVGIALGHATVAEAMADPALAAFVERMMREDIAPTLRPPHGLDVAACIDQVLARFRNPAIVHRLSQIAWDGSQKLPFRLLSTIADALAAGRPVARVAVGVAAWIRFVQTNDTITDPLADTLKRLASVEDFLACEAVFPPALAADPRFRHAVHSAHATLAGDAPREVLVAGS